MGCLESRENQEKDKTISILGYQEVKQHEINEYYFGVSPDQKYLATLSKNGIEIINLKTSLKKKEIRKQRNFNHIICCGFDFFENSRMVCCVVNSSRIQIFRADNYYKQIKSINGQNGLIKQLKIINQHYILCCIPNNLIVVIDYTNKSQMIKIIESFYAQNVQTDEKRIQFGSMNQVIISHSSDQINFYKMNGNCIFKFNENYIYERIQTINNTNQLIGSSSSLIVLWLIDYQQGQLIKLKQFKNQSYIIRTQIFLQSLIIIFDKYNIIILDMNDLEIIYKQGYNSEGILPDIHCKISTTASDNIIIQCFRRNNYDEVIGSIKILKILM